VRSPPDHFLSSPSASSSKSPSAAASTASLSHAAPSTPTPVSVSSSTLGSVGVAFDSVSRPSKRANHGTALNRANARVDREIQANPTSAAAIAMECSRIINDMCDQQEASKLVEADLRQELQRALNAQSYRRTYDQLRLCPERLRLDTGFRSLLHMEVFLWFLCNGDWSVLDQLVCENNDRADLPEHRQAGGGRKRALCWRDSFLLYRMHLFAPGATAQRLALDFGVSESTATAIIRSWAAAEYLRWQAVGAPTILEHLCLGSPGDQWRLKHPNLVAMEHDTTNLPLLGHPSDFSLSGLVANDYYGEDCLKAMISCSTWSYLMVPPAPLWTGGITDTLHLRANGILRRQQQQVEEYIAMDGANQQLNVRFAVLL
jgi:hypothetical protein